MGIRTGWRNLVHMRRELTEVLAALNGIQREMAKRNDVDALVDHGDVSAIQKELRLHRRYHEITRYWMIDSVMREVSELTDKSQLDFTRTLEYIDRQSGRICAVW